jgi:hypothetical protein
MDSDSETVDDGGTDSDTDTGTGFPGVSIVLPTEDLLPDWSLEWGKATGGCGMDSVQRIAVTGPDTFVASGQTLYPCNQSDEISFDGISIPSGNENLFLVKYNIEGKVLWATWAGDGATMIVLGVDALEQGRIAVVGWCGNGALFGPGEPNETWVFVGTAPLDAPTSFFAVYEPDGTLAWVRSLLLVDQTYPKSRSECLAVDILDDGPVLAAGQFDGTVVAGAGTPTETTLVRDPDGEPFAYNAFIVKYDADGNLLWARREGGPGKTVASGLAAMPDGSFFLSGGFEGTAVFGEGQVNETALASLGTESAFLARFDPDGNLEWVTDLGVDGLLPTIWIPTGSLSLLSNGDVAIPGSYCGSMLAGDGEAVSPVATETWGLFLSRYTAEGERAWTRVAPGNGSWGLSMGQFNSIAELDDGTLVAVCGFNGTMLFGAGEPNETAVHSTGNPAWDAMVAAYSSSGDFLWALPQGGTGWDFFGDIVRFPGETPESDILITGGGFSSIVTFGTGGDDVVTLTATDSDNFYDYDIVILRFDREAQ